MRGMGIRCPLSQRVHVYGVHPLHHYPRSFTGGDPHFLWEGTARGGESVPSLPKFGQGDMYDHAYEYVACMQGRGFGLGKYKCTFEMQDHLHVRAYTC